MRLEALAQHLGVAFRGDPDVCVDQVATIDRAQSHQLSFLSNTKYRHHLSLCQAGVLIISEQDLPLWSGNALISPHVYLTYAQAAYLLCPPRPSISGIHPSAVLDASAMVDASASIGANCCVGAGAVIGARVVIGAGAVIDAGVVLGDDCWIGANVTILHDCQLGQSVTVESGSVIGSEGFGWAKQGVSWVKVPQLGRVVIGNHVSIGANVCIDRGAIDDTIISDGVKLDNLIQIAHNVHIGEHTAIAGASAIAGSTRIGAHCTIAGKVGIAGHLTIADHVHISAMTLVSHDILKSGVYSGSLPQDTRDAWRRNAVRFRQLDEMAKRLKMLEKAILVDTGDAEQRQSD